MTTMMMLMMMIWWFLWWSRCFYLNPPWWSFPHGSSPHSHRSAGHSFWSLSWLSSSYHDCLHHIMIGQLLKIILSCCYTCLLRHYILNASLIECRQHLPMCFKKFIKFFTKDISLSRTFYRFTTQCNDDELWSLWWWWWWWCIENDDDDDDDECWRSFFLFHSSAFSSELGRLGKRSTDNCVDCRDCDNSDESCNCDYYDHDDLEIVFIVIMVILNL